MCKFCKIIVIFCIFLITIVHIDCSESDGNENREIHLNEEHCTLDDLRNINELSEINRVEIYLSNCHVPTVTNSAFLHFNSIVKITIENSSVSGMDKNALNGLDHLESLIITGNNLSIIDNWSPHDLAQLNVLNLHRNAIREISVSAFRRYPHLSNLILSENMLTELPHGLFGKISHLQIVNLATNYLRRIESDIFKALLRLEELYLNDNQITFIDPLAFATNARLKDLQLKNNRIANINSDVFFTLPLLMKLDFSQNILTELNIDFGQNSELKILDISHNKLRELQWNALNGLTSLKMLNLSFNSLLSIQSNAFKDLSQLRALDLSQNKLTHLLDNQFATLESIETLNISHNLIEDIQPFTFTDLKMLKMIDLSINKLQKDEFIQKIISLYSVDLKKNLYRKLNFTTMNGIEHIYLAENPWSCEWLVDALVNSIKPIGNELHFGQIHNHSEYETLSVRKPEEVICYSERNSDANGQPIQRNVIIVYPQVSCSARRQKKILTLSDSGATFGSLLSNEFDLKACLLWTVIAVCIVIAFIQCIKYCLEKAQRRSERYRLTQQEKVLQDIEEYFSRNEDKHTG